MGNKSDNEKSSVSWLIVKVPNLSKLEKDKSQSSLKSLKSNEANFNVPVCNSTNFDKIINLNQKLFSETKHSKSVYKGLDKQID